MSAILPRMLTTSSGTVPRSVRRGVETASCEASVWLCEVDDDVRVADDQSRHGLVVGSVSATRATWRQ